MQLPNVILSFTTVRNYLPLLILLLSLTSLDLAAQEIFRYSQAEADTILLDFNEAVKTYHPFAFRGEGAKSLDSILVILRERLTKSTVEDSIHVADLIELTSTYNELLGDGHLQLTRKKGSDYAKKKKLYNYEFYTRYVDDGRVVLSDTLILLDSTTYYPGVEVLSFQGKPAQQIFQTIGSFIGLGDHDLASAKTYFPALDPASFYQRLYGWKDSLTVSLLIDNKPKEITLIPSVKQAYLNRDTTKNTKTDEVKKLSRKQKKQERIDRLNRLVRLDTTSNPDVYRFSIRTFSSSAFEKVNQYKTVKNIMKRVDSLQPKGIIIDLRNNTGGSLNFVNYIFSTIATSNFYSGDAGFGYAERAGGKNFFSKIGSRFYGGVRKKNGVFTKKSMSEKCKPEKGAVHYDGEVIVLVNETTFSGGTCFANYVQTYKRGKVVGQVAGGSAERMFAGTLFKKPIGPDGSLLINMPLWYMDMPGDQTGNLTPDVIVPREIETIIAQEDRTLEVALEQFTFNAKKASL